MKEKPPNMRTDPELNATLDEAAEWAVRGEGGATVLGPAASLRAALALASTLVGQKIIALTQGPNDRIIVFKGQMERLLEAR